MVNVGEKVFRVEEMEGDLGSDRPETVVTSGIFSTIEKAAAYLADALGTGMSKSVEEIVDEYRRGGRDITAHELNERTGWFTVGRIIEETVE